jgi:hypothetical protein
MELKKHLKNIYKKIIITKKIAIFLSPSFKMIKGFFFISISYKLPLKNRVLLAFVSPCPQIPSFINEERA